MIHFFADSDALQDYLDKYNVITWCNGYGMGSLTFIDCSSLHVVFDTREDYEDWDADGRPVQFCLGGF